MVLLLSFLVLFDYVDCSIITISILLTENMTTRYKCSTFTMTTMITRYWTTFRLHLNKKKINANFDNLPIPNSTLLSTNTIQKILDFAILRSTKLLPSSANLQLGFQNSISLVLGGGHDFPCSELNATSKWRQAGAELGLSPGWDS